MKIIDLNNLEYSFNLWEKEYFYTKNNFDKELFLKMVLWEKNIDDYVKFFQNILWKQNKNIIVGEADIFGLFHFFITLYLL